MRWNEEQDEILFIYANKGVKACQVALINECGVWRSISSICSHASRIGVSLVQYEVCVACGSFVRANEYKKSTGLCTACHTKALRDNSRRVLAKLQDKAAKKERSMQQERYNREYAAARQANSRYIKSHNNK